MALQRSLVRSIVRRLRRPRCVVANSSAPVAVRIDHSNGVDLQFSGSIDISFTTSDARPTAHNGTPLTLTSRTFGNPIGPPRFAKWMILTATTGKVWVDILNDRLVPLADYSGAQKALRWTGVRPHKLALSRSIAAGAPHSIIARIKHNAVGALGCYVRLAGADVSNNASSFIRKLANEFWQAAATRVDGTAGNSTAVTANTEWTNIALVYDEDNILTVMTYDPVQGYLKGVGASPIVIDEEFTTLILGASATGGAPGLGDMDQVLVMDGVLTEDEFWATCGECMAWDACLNDPSKIIAYFECREGAELVDSVTGSAASPLGGLPTAFARVDSTAPMVFPRNRIADASYLFPYTCSLRYEYESPAVNVGWTFRAVPITYQTEGDPPLTRNVGVYLPAEGANWPVAYIFAVGALATHLDYAPLGRFLASHGYPTVFVEFRDGGGGNPYSNAERRRQFQQFISTDRLETALGYVPAKIALGGHSGGFQTCANVLGSKYITEEHPEGVSDPLPIPYGGGEIIGALMYSGQGILSDGLLPDSYSTFCLGPPNIPSVIMLGTNDDQLTGGDWTGRQDPFDLAFNDRAVLVVFDGENGTASHSYGGMTGRPPDPNDDPTKPPHSPTLHMTLNLSLAALDSFNGNGAAANFLAGAPYSHDKRMFWRTDRRWQEWPFNDEEPE